MKPLRFRNVLADKSHTRRRASYCALATLSEPGAGALGAVDADGNCLGTIEIFSGRAARCRPAGLSTSFQNCCKDKGEIVKDGMGSSISSIGTKIAVAKGVFTGMSAAYTAFKAGATASQAASAGANALIVGLVHNEAGIEHYGGDEGFRRVADMLPLKRMASPEDVANAVLMMCSDRAAYISGANLEVDGGGEVPVFLHLANASSTAK